MDSTVIIIAVSIGAPLLFLIICISLLCYSAKRETQTPMITDEEVGETEERKKKFSGMFNLTNTHGTHHAFGGGYIGSFGGGGGDGGCGGDGGGGGGGGGCGGGGC